MCWQTEKWLGEIKGLVTGWEGGSGQKATGRRERGERGGEVFLYKGDTCWWKDEMTAVGWTEGWMDGQCCTKSILNEGLFVN